MHIRLIINDFNNIYQVNSGFKDIKFLRIRSVSFINLKSFTSY
jgi:hypothetical protein